MSLELDFLAIINEFPEVVGIGDDCAVHDIDGDNMSLLSTDMLVEGNHFPKGFRDFVSLGEKCITVNVSDIFASGGTPEFIYVALALPSWFGTDDLKALYQGFSNACGYFSIKIAGGDITSTHGPLVISITVTGKTRRNEYLSRGGACVEDDVYVSGVLGGACASGYPVFRGYFNLLPKEKINYIIKTKAAHCLTDVSDGLARSLKDVAQASRKGFVIDLDRIPLATGASLRDAMCGGEDYQVFFTAPVEAREQFSEEDYVRIGTVLTCRDILLRDGQGTLIHLTQEGYDHFKVNL